MRKFVFWTGIYDIILGIILWFPPILKLLGVGSLPTSNFWLDFLGIGVAYAGIVLVLSSRNISSRAPAICWEGILRIAAFFLCIGFGIFGGLGVLIVLLGIIELAIGLVYLIGLPKVLKTSARNLLLDR
jgi:hypothetical protein